MVVHITGLGKTRTAVESAVKLLEGKEVKRVWVVAPLATHGQWRDEIAARGSGARRWDICTHEAMSNRSWREQLSECLLIVDEAHKLRTIQTVAADAAHSAHSEGYGAIRTARGRGKRRTFFEFGKRASAVFDASKAASRVLLLTATPVFNSSMDLHNLGAMLHGQMLAATIQEWEEKVKDPVVFASIFGGQVSVQLELPLSVTGALQSLHASNTQSFLVARQAKGSLGWRWRSAVSTWTSSTTRTTCSFRRPTPRPTPRALPR